MNFLKIRTENLLNKDDAMFNAGNISSYRFLNILWVTHKSCHLLTFKVLSKYSEWKLHRKAHFVISTITSCSTQNSTKDEYLSLSFSDNYKAEVPGTRSLVWSLLFSCFI